MTVATATTRDALVDELTRVVHAPHEARFIVDEARAVCAGASPSSASSSSSVRPGSLGAEVAAAARQMAARRAAGEPLQYVFGHWPFRSLDLIVTPDVLIPRPETEQVTEVALRELRRIGVDEPVMVDVGTGSGAIALSLAAESGRGTVWATDASRAALAVAIANLDRVRQRADRSGALCPVTFVEGDWLEPLRGTLRGRVDLVVSNPPYVAESEWEVLPAEVRAEPHDALVAAAGSEGTPGLAGVEAVLAQARAWLASPGVVVVELAPHQAASAIALARALGYREVYVEADLAGRDRALVAHVG